MTEFGSVLGPFFPCILIKKSFHIGRFVEIVRDEVMPKKSPVDTTLVASSNIPKNILVYRCYPSVHFDKY